MQKPTIASVEQDTTLLWTRGVEHLRLHAPHCARRTAVELHAARVDLRRTGEKKRRLASDPDLTRLVVLNQLRDGVELAAELPQHVPAMACAVKGSCAKWVLVRWHGQQEDMSARDCNEWPLIHHAQRETGASTAER